MKHKTETSKPDHGGKAHVALKSGASVSPQGKTGPTREVTLTHFKKNRLSVGANAPHNPLKPKLTWNTRGATVKKAKAKRYPIPNQKRELQKNV